MLYLVMLVLYLALIAITLKFMRKKPMEPTTHIPVQIRGLSANITTLAILKAIFKNSLLLMKNWALIIISLTMLLSTILAGVATTAHAEFTERIVTSNLNIKGIYIKFDEYVDEHILKNYFREYDISLIIYSISPLEFQTDIGKRLFYVISFNRNCIELLGLPHEFLECPVVDVSSPVRSIEFLGSYVAPIHMNLRILSRALFEGEEILPTLSYIGIHALKPPLNALIILPPNLIDKVLGTFGEDFFRISVIVKCKTDSDLERLKELSTLISKSFHVKLRAILINGRAKIVGILRSIRLIDIFAICLAIMVATLTTISATQALLPRIKTLSEVLTLIGTPTWIITILIYGAHLILAIIGGIVALVILYVSVGSQAILNGVLALIPASMISHIILRRATSKYVLALEILPTPTDIIIPRILNPEEVIEYISKILKTDELFEVLESRSFKLGNMYLVKFELLYRYAIGIGAELDVIIEEHKNKLRITVNARPWSIEEVGEKYLASISRSIISRVLGALKICQLR